MAGLAVGYYARKRGLPFTVYESDGRHGGNCATFRHKEFSFDLGSHRFHDKIEAYPFYSQSLCGLCIGE
jgi:protoporphyrinogen oxidase